MTAVYPSPEERDRLHRWLARPLKGTPSYSEIDRFGWCRHNLSIVALSQLERGAEDLPEDFPFTIQDAFELMEKGLRK